VTFLVFIGLLVALAIVFIATIGLGPLAIVPIVIAALAGIWFLVAMVRSGGAPSDPVRQAPKAELLGPGGPDDPEA
jgi:xanthine/uracil permease